MQAMNTQVDSRALTRLDDFVLQLLLHLCHYFFYSGRVNTPIGYKLVKGKTANLATNGVESRDNDGLGRVVYNDFNTRSSFQGADVTSFTTDDTTLYLVVVDVENAHRVFYCGLGSHTLDGLYNNLLGLLVCVELRLVNYLIDVASCISLGFVFQTLDESFFSLFST